MKLDYGTIKYIINQLDKETLYILKEAIFEKEQEEKEEKISYSQILYKNIKK